jgi:uncharacterized protein (DUF1015 family)
MKPKDLSNIEVYLHNSDLLNVHIPIQILHERHQIDKIHLYNVEDVEKALIPHQKTVDNLVEQRDALMDNISNQQSTYFLELARKRLDNLRFYYPESQECKRLTSVVENLENDNVV